MGHNHRNSGIDAVGSVSWGAHFCQFYRDESDLAETLVPFFKTGLEANEACLWITSGSLTASRALELLREEVFDLDLRIQAGQLEIVPIDSWYSPGDSFDADAVLESWRERERLALERGFDGLRLSGDTIWVERSGWDDFMHYERKVNGAFKSLRLVALCTYCSDTCSASDVIDVCGHHEFALARRNGSWHLLESSSLKIAKDELARLNSDLELRVEQRTADLAAALSARDEFLAMLGHELRNPLAPIQTASQFIQRAALGDSNVAKSAAILNRQVSHLTRLVDDLLDVARVTKGQIPIAPQEVSLASIVELAAEQARPFLEQRGHTFTLRLANPGVYVHVDPTRMAQVFGNLLHNAAKYTPDGGKIEMSTEVEAGRAVVRVSDNGAGIPQNQLEGIFELFSQLPRSLDRSDGGLGIGLTLAKRVVQAHLGQIEARSDGIDCGSEFTVRLDLAREQTPDIHSEQPAHRGVEERASRMMRVVVVDDNHDARDTLAAVLSFRYEVHQASHARQAMELVARDMPDAMVLDIGLPDIDGYQLARMLRALPGGADVKLIALTGYGLESDRALARAAGFDEHIVKPANMDALFAKIENPRGQAAQ